MQERNTDTTEDATEEHRQDEHARSRRTVESDVTGPVTERDIFNEESHHGREAGTEGETPSRENTPERTGDGRPRQPAGTVDATAGGVERLSLSFFVLLYHVLSSCVARKKEKTHGPVTTLSTAFGGGR